MKAAEIMSKLMEKLELIVIIEINTSGINITLAVWK
jgi:hypothetical protein